MWQVMCYGFLVPEKKVVSVINEICFDFVILSIHPFIYFFHPYFDFILCVFVCVL